MPGKRKVKIGHVVSDKMQKTVVVAVTWKRHHRLYKKRVRHLSKFYAHDEQGQAKVGDLVKIEEIRPLSKLKHWRVLQVLRAAEVFEVKPEEVAETELKELQEQEKPPDPATPEGPESRAGEEAKDDSDIHKTESSR